MRGNITPCNMEFIGYNNRNFNKLLKDQTQPIKNPGFMVAKHLKSNKTYNIQFRDLRATNR